MRTTRRLCLEPCDRGDKESRPILFLRNAPQASVLVLTGSGFECEVLLSPRFARLLILLVDAWHEDAELPESMRGFRSAKRLSNLYRRFVNGRGSVEVETIINYVFEIRQLLAKEYPNLCAPVDTAARESVDLIEHRPNQGYRIGRLGLEIFPSSNPEADPDEDPDANFGGASDGDRRNG